MLDVDDCGAAAAVTAQQLCGGRRREDVVKFTYDYFKNFKDDDGPYFIDLVEFFI